MKRKIKFRGKRLDNGEWVYGDLLHPATSCRIVSYTPAQDSPHGSVGVDYHYHDIDPATVGQYTGLRDRNGKEIYEGDIVKVGFLSEPFCEVRYCKDSFMAYQPHGLGYYISEVCKDCKVVGNVHDNPQLLK